MLFDQDQPLILPDNLPATNLKEVIEQRCRLQPTKLAINFLHDGELDSQEPLSYADLDLYARSILSVLHTCSEKGDRALLLLSPGNAFLASFVACLYGGIVAVPVAVPGGRARDWDRVFAILEDCQPAVVLSCGVHFRQMDSRMSERTRGFRCDVVDVADVPASRAGVSTAEVVGADLAFLQYTSGSTGNPKGVMVTHDNLLHNQNVIQTAYDHGDDPRLVTWLPMFHDMGLIGCALHALYVGAELHYMAPAAFLQRPMRWMRAVSRFRATGSGAPNFAYDLCVARYDAKECEDLDLSTWRRAFNGAEQVRAGTLGAFHRTYAPHGFGSHALYPTYGLAEAVLLVAGPVDSAPPKLLRVQAADYARSLITPAEPHEDGLLLVGVGRVLGGQRLLVVDPRTRVPVEPGQLGEIWLSGPSVAKGYWQNEEATRECFRARPLGTADGPEYLRTGDLGYLDEHGELYITGRLKDTIIISGKNCFPQDIEHVVETVDPALRAGGGAVFSVENAGQERIVVLHEVSVTGRKNLDPSAVIKAIRARVATEFQLNVFDVCLLKPLGLLKTTSGKVQRQRNKQAYLAGDLKILAQHRGAPRKRGEALAPTGDGIFRLVTEWIKALPGAPSEVAQDDLFVDTGMDSAQAESLAHYLSEQLGRRVDVTLIWSHPEVFDFCQAVAAQLGVTSQSDAQPTTPAEAKPNVHAMDDEAFYALLEKELS